MARQYPRFLFSDPQNTKSEGPFVVHLLPPKMLLRVEFDNSSRLKCVPMEVWDECSNTSEAEVIREAQKFAVSQIQGYQIEMIKLPKEAKYTGKTE